LGRHIITFIIFFFILISNAFAVSADSLFVLGNDFYEAKEYDSAITEYQKLLKDNYHSAELYFNLGNCYYKKGDLGYAILNYLRAQRLDPTDDDIKANLAFARQFMPTRLEGVKINPVSEFFDTLVSPITLDSAAWISSILFIILLLYLSLVVYLQMRGGLVKLISISLLILFVVVAGLTTYKFRREYVTKTGVIVAENTKILSSPANDGEVEFIGNFGLVFTVEKSVEDYYLVIFENKRKGWIKKADVELI